MPLNPDVRAVLTRNVRVAMANVSANSTAHNFAVLHAHVVALEQAVTGLVVLQ